MAKLPRWLGGEPVVIQRALRRKATSMESLLFRTATITWVMVILWINFGVLLYRGDGILGLINLVAAAALVGVEIDRRSSEFPSARQLILVALGSVVLAGLLYMEVSYVQTLPRASASNGRAIIMGPFHDWANENIVWLSAGSAVFFAFTRAFRYMHAIRRWF